MPEDRPEDYRPGSGQATNPQDGAGQRPVQDGGNSIVRVNKEWLVTKTNKYGGMEGQFSYRCEKESTKWTDMKKVNYWSTGSIQGQTNGNVLTLETNDFVNQDSWIEAPQDDFVNISVGHNSYVDMEVELTVSNLVRDGYVTQAPPYSERFKVCLEENDSLSATVGSSLYNFSLIKQGGECISQSFIADLNAMGWTNFRITIKLKEGVHCKVQDEYVAPIPAQPGDPDFIGPLQAPEGGSEGMTPDDSVLDSQDSLYAILGMLLLIGMFLFIRAGVTGGSSDD